MKRTEKDAIDARAVYRTLPFPRKLEHIWIYYKWPILLGLTALIILGSVLYRTLTKKERVLYLGYANVAVGSELDQTLSEGYLEYAGLDAKKNEIYVYRDLYLSEDAVSGSLAHQNAYASQIKLMAAIESKELDLVLMSKQAYDILSGSDYLLSVSELLRSDPALFEQLRPMITENAVIIEDNAIEYRLGEAEELIVKTEPKANALCLNALPLFSEAFTEPVYLGVIANSERLDACLDYLRYLTGD